MHSSTWGVRSMPGLRWIVLGGIALVAAVIFGSTAGGSQQAAHRNVKTQTQRVTNTYPNGGNDGPP
jgi:hypothetical protein